MHLPSGPAPPSPHSHSTLSSDAHHPTTTAFPPRSPPLCLTLHSTTHHPRHQPSFTFHGNCLTSPFTSSLLSYPPSTAHPEAEGQPQPLQEVKRCPSQQLHHRRLSNYTHKEWGPSTYHFINHSAFDLLGLQQPLSQYVDELLETSTITQALLTPTHQGSAREGG